MLVTLILPQLVFQYFGDGKAFGGKNWQGWRGAFKQYQEKITDRYTIDKGVIDRLKLATTKEEQENIMLGASDEMRQYANSVGMSIEKMEKFNEQAKASAHPIQALKAGIKGLGKELAAIGIQFATFWVVSKLIEIGVNWIDSWVNALKYAKEAAENLNKAYEDMNTTQKQSIKTVEEYGKTWEKLKDGVDKQGKNVSLSDDEYEQYKNAIEQISNVIPNITSNWDASNEAIKLNVESVDQLNQKMEEYAQKQRETLLAGDETKAFADKASKVDLAADAKTKQEALDLLQTIQRRDIASLQEYANNHPDLSGELEPYVTMAQDYLWGWQEQKYTGEVTGDVPTDDWWTDAFSEMERELAKLETTNSDVIDSIVEGWRNSQSLWTAIQFSSVDSTSKVKDINGNDFNTLISEDLQTAIQSLMNSQDERFYGQFGTLDDMYTYLRKVYTETANSVSDEATKAYQKAAEQWQSGKLSYGDYAKARQSYVNSWNDLATKDRSFYDLLVPYLRDYFGGGMDEYSAMRQRAQEKWNFTQEQVDSLTSEQLNYIKSLGADTEKVFTSFAAFLADFAKYQTQVETSYDGLKTKWDKATEAQTAAQEVMTATDANGGVLTQENYNKLIGANKAYGAAVTTIGGVTTIDSDRLNSSNL